MVAPKKKNSYQSGHRKRLRSKFLMTKLTDVELLELLLCSAVPGRDVKPIAHALCKEFGDLGNLPIASIEELLRVEGVGESIAIFLKAIQEFTKRCQVHTLKKAPVFHNWQILEAYCKNVLGQKLIEEFYVLHLDSCYKLILEQRHSVGTVDGSSVYPREVLRACLNNNTKYVVLVHNHPNKEANFSTEDVNLTQELIDVLAQWQINFYDHLLVCGNVVFSAKNADWFKSSGKLLPAPVPKLLSTSPEQQ